MSTQKIVLIDSGINMNHQALQQMPPDNLYTKQGETITMCGIEEAADTLGHGTGVYYLLRRSLPDAHISVVKLYERGLDTEVEELVITLAYIHEHIACDIIHLSSGVPYCDELAQLRDICKKITDSGTIIIAAFDNEGVISYPAAFDNVIGVDWSLSCKRTSEFEFVEGSPLNIRGVGTEQRIPWLGSDYNTVGGASFSTPYITGFVYNLLKEGITDFNDILANLKQNAKKIHEEKKYLEMERCFPIKKALLFPFNKEVHSLIRFADVLPFEIKEVCDLKALGNVGKSPVSQLPNCSLDTGSVIANIDKIAWEKSDFDTLILSHTIELSSIFARDFIKELLEKSLMYRKNLYCFDDLTPYGQLVRQMEEKGLRVYSPYINKEHLPPNRFGKLRQMGKPVIGIFGTSSRQGKFTLQLFLRKKFMASGYKVGQLGSEPSAPLFGFDEVYPMGYGSTIDTSVRSYASIHMINHLLGRIEDKNPDIIIIGAQSQTVPLNTGNLGFYPLYNHEMILASEPDLYILCINIFDDIDYIKRTINYLESVTVSTVLSLVLFPVERNLKWSVFGNTSKPVAKDLLTARRLELQQELQKQVYILGVDEDMEKMYQECIDHF